MTQEKTGIGKKTNAIQQCEKNYNFVATAEGKAEGENCCPETQEGRVQIQSITPQKKGFSSFRHSIEGYPSGWNPFALSVAD